MYLGKKNKWISFIFLLISLIPLGFSKENLNSDFYLNKSDFNPVTILPSPSKSESEETKDEITIIKTRMSKLTQSQKDLAREDALNLSVTFFADTISGFNIDQLPKTKLLFEKVKYNAGIESQVFKKFYMRKRPYQVDPSIEVCVPPMPDNLNHSYPSGHTILGYAMGIVLANLIPEKSKEIMDRARLYGENRINCGAHFPSDVNSGQVLGSLVAFELLKNNEFKLLMQSSKEELVKASLTDKN